MSAPDGLIREYTYCWSIWRGWVYCKTEERWDAGVETYWEENQNEPEVQRLLEQYEKKRPFFQFFIRLFNIGNLGKIVSAKDYYQKLAQEEEYMQQPSPHFFQWLWQGFLNSLWSIGRLFHFSSRRALQVQSGQEDEEFLVDERSKGSPNFSTDSQQKDYFKIFAKDLKDGEFKGLLDGLKTLGLIEEKEAEEFLKNGYVELSRTIYRARFRQLAREHHPDRHVKKSEAEIQQASKQFVKIQEAYQKIEEVLKNWKGREKSKGVREFSQDVSSQVTKYAELWEILREIQEDVRECGEGIREFRESNIKTRKQAARMWGMVAEIKKNQAEEQVSLTPPDDEKDVSDLRSPVSPKDQNFSNQSVGVAAVSREENSVGSGHVGAYRELSQSREDGSRSGSSSPKSADRSKDGHRRTVSF